MRNEALDGCVSSAFKSLKNRDHDSPAELDALVRTYEGIRRVSEELGDEVYEAYSVITGRALSNLAYDTMKMDGFQTLEAASAAKDFSGEDEIFFLAHRGGLCNRLRAMASLMVFSKLLGCTFKFSWFETEMCNGGAYPSSGFSSLLSDAIMKSTFRVKNVIFEDNPATPWWYYDTYKGILPKISWADFESLYRSFSEQLLADLIEALGLQGYLEEFVDRSSLHEYEALHIRRTDFVEYYKEKYPGKSLPSVEDYMQYVESSDANVFFLSTDDVCVKRQFLDKFGENKVVSLDFAFDENSFRQTSLSHAVLDLYLLSRAKSLVVTPGSSFSGYAASVNKGTVVNI